MLSIKIRFRVCVCVIKIKFILEKLYKDYAFSFSFTKAMKPNERPIH